MAAFDICISKTTHHDIPDIYVRRAQTMEIAQNPRSIKKEQVQELVEVIGSKGRLFCPSTFNGDRPNKDYFKQTQLFALAFNNLSNFNRKHNNNFSFDDIAQRARQYNLPIFFAYDIFSDFHWEPNCKAFCVVFINEMPIYNLREAEAIQKALLNIFPEADREHGSVIDLYFGGNAVLYYDETMPTINPDIVFMNMCLYLKNRFGPTNYKRKVAEFAEETGIILDDRGLPVISIIEDTAEKLRTKTNCRIDENFDENSWQDSHQKNNKNSPKPYIEKENDGEKLSRLTYTIKFHDDTNQEASDTPQVPSKSSIHQLYRSSVIKSLGFNCELYHEFESGSRRTWSFQELFGLATNLARVESGSKVFTAILKSKNLCDDDVAVNCWNYYFYYIKRRNPYPCSCFCPYYKTCTHGKNILSTCSIKPHQIERVYDYEEQLVSLDEASRDFKRKFMKAVKSSDNVWHVIRSQTALGKTQMLLQFIKDNPDMNILIVVPTNMLKREVADRANAMGIDLIVSPSLHEIKDDIPVDIWDDIESLLDSGRSPIPSIKKAIEEEKRSHTKFLKQYMRERDKFYGSDGCAVTTHRRLASVDLSKYDLVIIDEDYIFSTVLADKTAVSISDLKRLIRKLPARDSLHAKIKRILKNTEKHDFFTVDKIYYDKEYSDIDMEINIPALCDGTHFYYRGASDYDNDCVVFTKKPNLPNCVKYIMLSATADKDICEYCFGSENVRFYDCKEARLTGTLNQYYERPMSRAYLDEHPEVLKQIKEWTGSEHTITFKKFASYCTDGMYFGNCVGCDVLKGQNIDVIGTPHQPEWIYKLFAFMLGFSPDTQLNHASIVTHNGFRFRFTTFDDEILRKIQFYIIETDLEQAVGRARLLRCDATVNLFSNFPLRQAILKESEYDKFAVDI